MAPLDSITYGDGPIHGSCVSPKISPKTIARIEIAIYMESYTFQIKSSSDDSYNAVFEWTGEEVTKATCDCQAGKFGDFCKHLRSFFEEDRSLLLDPDPNSEQGQTFPQICRLLKNSTIFDAYKQLQIDLAAIEVNQKALKKAAANLKSTFVKTMNGKL